MIRRDAGTGRVGRDTGPSSEPGRRPSVRLRDGRPGRYSDRERHRHLVEAARDALLRAGVQVAFVGRNLGGELHSKYANGIDAERLSSMRGEVI